MLTTQTLIGLVQREFGRHKWTYFLCRIAGQEEFRAFRLANSRSSYPYWDTKYDNFLKPLKDADGVAEQLIRQFDRTHTRAGGRRRKEALHDTGYEIRILVDAALLLSDSGSLETGR